MQTQQSVVLLCMYIKTHRSTSSYHHTHLEHFKASIMSLVWGAAARPPEFVAGSRVVFVLQRAISIRNLTCGGRAGGQSG